jgi:hypothetical protein
MVRANVHRLALALTLAACGGPARGLPDYSELLLAGVEPSEEAERVAAHLARAGFEEAARAEVGGVIALLMVRPADGLHAVRIVTPRGVTVALEAAPEATGPDTVAAMRGTLTLDPRSGEDLDRDGRNDLLVVRSEPGRSCWLLLAVTGAREVEALGVDPSDLDAGLCLEDLRDVNDDGTIEAIVAVRAPSLARTRMPRAELPLERDEAGTYRRVPPAVSFLAGETARLDAALAQARAEGNAEACYTLAIERALLLRAAGRSLEAQLGAFDDAVAETVWPEAFTSALDAARSTIAGGRW